MKRTAMPSTILFAGDEPHFASLVQRFQGPGCIAAHALDGNVALQKALELKPTLVVIDVTLRAIPAPKLSQILRTNRQGTDLEIVFVGEEGVEVEGFVRHRDTFFPRPLNLSQIRGHIEKHLVRLEQAQQLLAQTQEVKGSLDQLGIPDLLQLFKLNSKSGTLFLAHGPARGAVLLEEGQVVGARLGRVDGEKALYRLILWTSGTFRFTPGTVSVGESVRISAPMDHLIMEGLRLADETAAQAQSLPSLASHMQLALPRERLPQGLRSATREILLKLETYPRVSDLLDHCPYADLQILQVLRVLREKGVISVSSPENGTETAPLLAAAEILAVHQSLFGATRLGEPLSVAVVLLGPSPGEVQDFLADLQSLPEFIPAAPAEIHPLFPVELGRLQLSDNFALRFAAVPVASEVAPLWSLYARQLFGAVTLAPAGTFEVAEKNFSVLGADLCYLGPQARQMLRHGNRGGWRELLIRFLPRFLKHDTLMEVS